MIRKFVMAFVGLSSALFGEIRSIDSLKEMDPYLHNSGSESLIVFDIDETLLIPDRSSFQRPNYEKHRTVIRELMQKVETQKQPLVINTMFLLSNGLLIEKDAPMLIQNWRKKGIKIMALSSAMSGKIEEVDLLEKRLKNFGALGLDFSTSFSEHEELVFPDHNVYYGASARFKKGVLHSNSCHRAKGTPREKGPILLEFLKTTKSSPKKIFFADDKLDILQEVEKTLQETNPDIEFIGFHYQGALHYPSKILNEKEMRDDWQKLIDKTNSLPMK